MSFCLFVCLSFSLLCINMCPTLEITIIRYTNVYRKVRNIQLTAVDVYFALLTVEGTISSLSHTF